jgi:hypothetical protein
MRAGNKTFDATHSGVAAGITLCNADIHDVLDSARLIVPSPRARRKLSDVPTSKTAKNTDRNKRRRSLK